MTLRIQRCGDGEVVVFALSGRIEAEHLAEIESLFQSEPGHNNLTIDLKEVKLVDRDGVAWLEACETEGAKLENCPAYIREWIDRERLGGKSNG